MARRAALNALCVYAIQYAVKEFMIDINVIDPDHYRSLVTAQRARIKELKKFPQDVLSYRPANTKYEHQLPEALYLGLKLYSNVMYGPGKEIVIGPKEMPFNFLYGNEGKELKRWTANVARNSGLVEYNQDGRRYPETHRSVKGYVGVDLTRFNLN